MGVQRSRLRNFLLVVGIGLALTAFLTAILGEFHEEITETWLQDADSEIVNYLHGHASVPLTRVMLVMSFLGSWKFLVPIVLAGLLLLLLTGNRREALILVTASGGAAFINIALKLWFQRARPSAAWALVGETSYSFPSGHSAAAFACYGVIAFIALRKTKIRVLSILIAFAAVSLIVGIGASRVYLGVHYPSDVAAGYLVGSIWLMGVVLGSTRLNRKHKSASEPDFVELAEISVSSSIREWKERARSLKRDVHALYLAKSDPRIPWYAKLLGAFIVAYALSPIDLIPDFIPVLGYLDDLILLPAAIVLLLKLIPQEVMQEYRVKASNPELRISKNWVFGALIVMLWLGAMGITARWAYEHFIR